MKILIFLAAVAVLYQNCAERKIELDQNPESSFPHQTFRASPSTIRSFTLRQTGHESHYRQVKFDLRNNSLTSGDEKLGCFSQEIRQRIEFLFSNADFCDPPDNSGGFCTMIYTPAYAELVFEGKEVQLGETRNGCEKPNDFCQSEQKEEFLEMAQWSIENVEECPSP